MEEPSLAHSTYFDEDNHSICNMAEVASTTFDFEALILGMPNYVAVRTSPFDLATPVSETMFEVVWCDSIGMCKHG